MAKIKDILSDIIYELSNVDDFGFNFATSRNGRECPFTNKAVSLFYKLSKIIHINDQDFKTIELEEFITIVKQCTIDFYTENKLNNFDTNYIELIPELKQYIKDTTKNKIMIRLEENRQEELEIDSYMKNIEPKFNKSSFHGMRDSGSVMSTEDYTLAEYEYHGFRLKAIAEKIKDFIPNHFVLYDFKGNIETDHPHAVKTLNSIDGGNITVNGDLLIVSDDLLELNNEVTNKYFTNEADATRRIIDHLIDNGYSSNNLVIDKKLFNSRRIADIVIEDNNQIVAVIEVKKTDKEFFRKKSERQLSPQYSDQLNSYYLTISENQKIIPKIFIVFYEDSIFTFYEFDANSQKVSRPMEFPSISDLLDSNILKSSLVDTWDSFSKIFDTNKLLKIKKGVSDENELEGIKLYDFLKKYKSYLTFLIPELKAYKQGQSQSPTQLYFNLENGFRIGFFKSGNYRDATQLNFTAWSNWGYGVYIKDNQSLIFNNNPETLSQYEREYPELIFREEHKDVFPKSFDMSKVPTEQEIISAFTMLLKLFSIVVGVEKKVNNDSLIINPKDVKLEKKEKLKPVFGVNAIAEIMTSLIINQPKDSGMMIGLFGKWGRGKTFLANEIWKKILAEEPKYEIVEFSAWKYQDTKASWAYLYENLITSYLKPKERVNTAVNFRKKGVFKLVINVYLRIKMFKDNIKRRFSKIWSYYNKIFQLNLNKNGVTPIILFTLFLGAYLYWSLCIGSFNTFRYIFEFFSLIVVIKLIFVYIKYKNSAIGLYHKYFSTKEFGEYLGLQSEIQNELKNLLQTWIPKKEKDKRIVLFVDDLDRCAITQVISVLDGLRIILDDEELYSKLIIVTALDEEILKQALNTKYTEVSDTEKDLIFSEYLEKVFIAGLKLNSLSNSESREFVSSLITDEKIKITRKVKPENIQKTSDFTDDIPKQRSATKETQKSKNNLHKEVELLDIYEITDYERDYLTQSIHKLDYATPRKIRIFYYKYLLFKQLLHARLEEKALINNVNGKNDYKTIIDLLIMMTNNSNEEIENDTIDENIIIEIKYISKMLSVL